MTDTRVGAVMGCRSIIDIAQCRPSSVATNIDKLLQIQIRHNFVCKSPSVIIVIMDRNSIEYDTGHELLLREIQSIDIPCVYLAYVGHHNVFVNRKRRTYPVIKIGVSSGAYARVNTQLKAEFGFARLVYYLADPRAQKIETRCKNDDRFKNHKVDVFKSNGTGSKECMALCDDWTLDEMKAMINDVAASFTVTDNVQCNDMSSDDLKLLMKLKDLEISKKAVELEIAKHALEMTRVKAAESQRQLEIKRSDNESQQNDPVRVWIDAHIIPCPGTAFNRADAWRAFTIECQCVKQKVFFKAIATRTGSAATKISSGDYWGWVNFKLI